MPERGFGIKIIHGVSHPLTSKSHIGFVLNYRMVFKLEKLSHISYFSFELDSPILGSLQEIYSLPTKITDGLNFVGNYHRNIDGTKHIIFSTFLLPFTDRILTENYRRKCSVGNFRAVCRRQLLGTIYRQNTYGKLPTEVFRR